MKLKIALTVGAVFLSGCSVTNKIPTDISTTNLKSNEGVAVFSISTDETCVSSASQLTAINASNSEKVDQYIAVDNYVMESDFTNKIGNLYVIPVEAGSYTFEHSVANPYMRSSKPNTDIFFTVKAKEIVYAGNIHNTGDSCAYNLSIHNEKSRDLALFTQKNKAVKTKDITTRLFVQN